MFFKDCDCMNEICHDSSYVTPDQVQQCETEAAQCWNQMYSKCNLTELTFVEQCPHPNWSVILWILFATLLAGATLAAVVCYFHTSANLKKYARKINSDRGTESGKKQSSNSNKSRNRSHTRVPSDTRKTRRTLNTSAPKTSFNSRVDHTQQGQFRERTKTNTPVNLSSLKRLVA